MTWVDLFRRTVYFIYPDKKPNDNIYEKTIFIKYIKYSISK